MNLSRIRNKLNPVTIFATTSLARAFSLESTSTCSIKQNMLPTIKVIPNDKLYTSEPPPQWFGNPSNPRFDDAWTNKNWLKSRFHFNFAEYHSGANVDFGVLRVLNDDLVQPKRGFGAHPHRNMEIITYIVEGDLTHKDSTGSEETLGRGSIQFMTAGTGIQHSEYNHQDKPLRFVQVWITPRLRDIPAVYGSYDAQAAQSDDPDSALTKRNALRHLASDADNDTVDTPVRLNQDVDCFAAELQKGKSVSIDVPKGRQAYLLCVEGSIAVQNKVLERHDAAEIVGGEEPLTIETKAVEDTENGPMAHFLLFVMKAVPGSGRKDIAFAECT